MKFSIIMPIYNVEKYLEKAIKSVLSQTYKDFELLLIDDGSTDNSACIAQNYTKDKRVNYFYKKNGGLSDARNFGVLKSKGSYILFLDSDDYYEVDLLNKINEVTVKKQYDLIHYLVKEVDENYFLKSIDAINKTGEITLEEFYSYGHCETAWSNAYKSSFYKKNNFNFSKGKIHEDFGLIPYIAAKSSHIYLLDYYGINYLTRQGSIINGGEKIRKRIYDKLYLFDEVTSNSTLKDKEKKLLFSFMANGLLQSLKFIDKQEIKKYKSELKKRNISLYLRNDSFLRKIKKKLVNLYIDKL